jgi:hypothetical protein
MRQCRASRRLDFSFLRGLTTIIFCAGAATDYELKKHRKEKKSGSRLRADSDATLY